MKRLFIKFRNVSKVIGLLILPATHIDWEAMALQWTDIDFIKDEISITRSLHFENNQSVIGSSKTETSARVVPLLPPLKRALSTIPLPSPSSLICTGASYQQMTLSAYKKAWSGYLDAMKQHDATFTIRPHDLRHTFCSMLYDAGVDVKPLKN